MFQRCLKGYVATSLLGTCAVGGFHFLHGTMINAGGGFGVVGPLHERNAYAEAVLRLRHEEPAFIARPLTTFAVESFISLGLGPWAALLIVLLGLLFVSGCALAIASRSWGADRNAERISQALYFLSFSVLFGFFHPIFAFDEPLQYSLIFFALALLQRHPTIAGLLLAVSMIARETSILVLPGILLTAWPQCAPKFSSGGFLARARHLFPLVAIPVVTFLVYRQIYPLDGGLTGRMSYFARYNFEGVSQQIQSVAALPLAMGLTSILAVRAAARWSTLSRLQQAAIMAAGVVFAVNTPLVYSSAHARELRLLALPLVFLWPVSGNFFLATAQAIRTDFQWRTSAVIGVSSLGVATYLLLRKWLIAIYANVEVYGWHRGHAVYLAALQTIFVFVAVELVIARIVSGRRSVKQLARTPRREFMSP